MAWPTSVAGNGDLYLAKNRLSSTLAVAIGVGDTTITLADASAFPTVGIVTIGGELIKHTGVSGNDLTGCTRGFDGTSPSAASIGALVKHNVVAQHHNVIKDELIAVEASLDLTASRAVETSASGRVAASSVTSTELGYLSGTTSAVQTQLGNKVAKAGDTMTGTLVMGFAGTAASPSIQLFSPSTGLATHGTYPYVTCNGTVAAQFKNAINYNSESVGSFLVNMGAVSTGTADLLVAFSESNGLRNTNSDLAGNGAVGFSIFGNREFTPRGATLNLEFTQNQSAGGGASINFSGRVNNSGDESRIFAKIRGAKRSSTNAEALGQCRIFAANAGTLTEGIRVDYDGKVAVLPDGSHPHSTLTVGGSVATAFASVSGNTTLTDAHAVVAVDATTGTVTITLPTAVGITGRRYDIKKIDSSANSVVIDGNASETIDGATTVSTTTQWQSFTVVSNGTNWYII